MSPQLRTRPAQLADDLSDVRPWSILPLMDSLIERRASTSTRLGMPLILHDLDDVLLGSETVTGIALNWRFWDTYVTATETGITYPSSGVRPVREEVQKLRDEIARRTRLTRHQISRAIGVDRRSLSAWVKGEATPGPDKVERLEVLADTIRDIDAVEPGTATDVLLTRTSGRDLLDHIAAGNFHLAREWRAWGGLTPVVTTVNPRAGKRALHQKALDAYLRGDLHPFGRGHTIRPASDYEQDLSQAERLLSDEPIRRSRRGYR